MVSFSSRISPRTSTVILRDKSPPAMAVATSAMLRTWPVRFEAIELTEFGQVLPGAGDAEHVGLAAEAAVGADFARHARHFAGEGVELIDHRVDGFFELQNFAGDVHRDLFRQVAAGDGRGDVGDVTDLGRQVAGHEVDAVGQVFPGAGDTRHRGLAAELAFGADFARHARHFRGERIELVHHRIDGVLQFENFAAHVDRDLARQVAARHGGGHCAMLRTWSVRLPHMALTESVKSFQVPATPGTMAWPPSLPSVPTSRATRVTSDAKERS